VRVTVRCVSQIPIVAIVSPIEDVFGGALAAVVVLIAQGMHCSGKCGTHDCKPKVREWWAKRCITSSSFLMVKEKNGGCRRCE